MKKFIAVWLSSFIILSLSALPFAEPGYMDAYYYHHVAANLAAGRGLIENYVWSYLPPPDSLVHPSNLYWMPLTSLTMAPFLRLLGDSFRVAQVPFVLLASLLVLFAYWLAIRLTGNLRHALAAAALTLFSGFYFAYWTSPDSFALFALAANLALLLSSAQMGSGLTPARRMGLAGGAGGLAALSHLARADGALVLAVALFFAGLGAWRSPGLGPATAGHRRALAMAAGIGACFAAYVLVMSPWFLRNWLLVGSLLPTAGVNTLFLREYNDIYTYGKDLSWESYIAWGMGPILRSKLEALGTNALVLFGMEYHLVPFALLGLWQLRRKTVFLPFFVYAAALYLTMSFLFTFPSGRGSMLHSSVVLLPWLSMAAAAGLDRSVVLAARRLRHWNVPLAQRNLTLVLVFFAIVFSVLLLSQEAGKREERYRHYDDIATWLRAAAPDALIMIADPPGYYYGGGKGSIVIPSDDLDTVLLAARRYRASYLVLEKVHSRPLHSLYTGAMTDPRLQRVVEIDATHIYRIGER